MKEPETRKNTVWRTQETPNETTTHYGYAVTDNGNVYIGVVCAGSNGKFHATPWAFTSKPKYFSMLNKAKQYIEDCL